MVEGEFDFQRLVVGGLGLVEFAMLLRHNAHLVENASAKETSQARLHLQPFEDRKGLFVVLAGVDEVLRRAVESDTTGAMVLYAMAMVVGPRLLVTLLDARTALSNDQKLASLFSDASMSVVREIRATGEVAKDQAPIEDEEWQRVARELSNTLDDVGKAESLGISFRVA